MKRTPRIILCSIFFVAFAAGMGVLLYFTQKQRHETSCNEVVVTVKDGEKFITEDEVYGCIRRGYGVCRGERLDSIGLDRIERMLCERPAVKGCQAWVTDDGLLHVEVTQRTPVMRFERKGEGYYVDKDGFIFPLAADYVAPVPVIESDLKKGCDAQWLENAIRLVSKVSASETWNQRIKAYAVNDEGDFILKGEATDFIFGDFTEEDRKFDYMEKYFTRVAPKRGEDETYTSVNLKYKGQIICRKDS